MERYDYLSLFATFSTHLFCPCSNRLLFCAFLAFFTACVWKRGIGDSHGDLLTCFADLLVRGVRGDPQFLGSDIFSFAGGLIPKSENRIDILVPIEVHRFELLNQVFELDDWPSLQRLLLLYGCKHAGYGIIGERADLCQE